MINQSYPRFSTHVFCLPWILRSGWPSEDSRTALALTRYYYVVGQWAARLGSLGCGWLWTALAPGCVGSGLPSAQLREPSRRLRAPLAWH